MSGWRNVGATTQSPVCLLRELLGMVRPPEWTRLQDEADCDRREFRRVKRRRDKSAELEPTTRTRKASRCRPPFLRGRLEAQTHSL